MELLLDDDTLEEIRRPLSALQKLIKDVYAPTVGAVPGVESASSFFVGNDQMYIDEIITTNGNCGHD